MVTCFLRRSVEFKKILIITYSILFILSSCSVSHQISQSADKILLKDSAISTGHIGISIYEPAINSYWYNYDATKYFVPASNTKLFTLYAGMKYLGDSLIAGRVKQFGSYVFLTPTGDPTFLHPNFNYQPLFNYLVTHGKELRIEGEYIKAGNRPLEPLGSGWVVDDYSESYMAERSTFPIYGNVAWFSKSILYPSNLTRDTLMDTALTIGERYIAVKPKFFADKLSGNPFADNKKFSIHRNRYHNQFYLNESDENFNISKVPFITNGGNTTAEILQSELKKNVGFGDLSSDIITKDSIIHSQPTDSLFKPMMHRSDNFFAEQTLLMVSNEHLGYMNDEDIIDTLLKKDLSDVPQKPKWVDGSGLSRYNLFTPQSFVYILNKMKSEFGLERLKVILPTGGEGTLKNYYLKDSGFIYAKTGSLSNNLALSGFLITKKNKLLAFSVLLNNFQGDSGAVRRKIELFLEDLRTRH